MMKSELMSKIESMKANSAWKRGVKTYALEMVEELEIESLMADRKELEALLLNGASDWSSYSWGGCSLIYDSDIAERLCSPSELKKTRDGERRPNSREEWLDVQARALYQACRMIKSANR